MQIQALWIHVNIFQEAPPSDEKGFSPEYTMASWFRILRVFALIVGFFKVIKQHINIYYIT